MNPEIKDNEDIFDIAIDMQYFKNYRSSSDNIHTYAKHFLYKSIYKKLLSFSKQELETVFWDNEKKEFHPNPKAKEHAIKFSHNIFQVVEGLRNSLFYGAFIEKGAFKEKYHPVVKILLKNKKTVHSLDFLETLYNIQTAQRLNEPRDSMREITQFNQIIFNFAKNLDTEEKNEVFMNFVNTIIQKPKDFVSFVLSNLNYFNEEHLLIINSKIKEHDIDINAYGLFETYFPKETDSSFFISSPQHLSLDKAYDFGFRANNYLYKQLDLPCAIFTYGLSGNVIGDTWQISFLKKVLKESSFEVVDKFIVNMGENSAKLKKHGSHFENIGKEALNKKLHEKYTESPIVKQPKI